MRPTSIRWFGVLYLLWLALAIVWECWVAAVFIGPRYPRVGLAFPIVIGCMIAAHCALNLALRYYIVRRPKPAARTTFTVLLVMGWSYFFYLTIQQALKHHGFLMNANMGFMTSSLAAQLGLMWLLFRPDSSAWLRGEAADTPEALEETFG